LSKDVPIVLRKFFQDAKTFGRRLQRVELLV
jgi:hypothetical protein